jgi:hypothetical protein
MAYSRSLAVSAWRTWRRDSISLLAQAHAYLGEVGGPGRPLEIGRPIGHAYIMRLVAEFQGFVRDLYDLGAEHLVTAAAPPPGLVAVLTTAITRGRSLDSGNPTMTSLRTDFGRLGIRDLEGKMAQMDAHWDAANGGTDPARYKSLIEVRNALAHGNQRQVDEHRRQGRMDTISWSRQQIPVLNRAASALDRVVWTSLLSRTGMEPW